MVAVNVFHMRGGKVLDRRDFFFEDLGEMESGSTLNTGELFSTLLQQIYLDNKYVPRTIYVPVEFEDREALEELLSEKRGRHVEIRTPQRGQKKALLDLVQTNAKHSFDARFRVLKPSSRAIQEALHTADEVIRETPAEALAAVVVHVTAPRSNSSRAAAGSGAV